MSPSALSKAVVTGGAGFLGSHLVDSLLARRHEVVAIDNLATGRLENLSLALRDSRFRLRQADLCTAVRLPRAERYYHIASPASPVAYGRDPIGTLLVNSEGTHHVLEAARRSDARVLIASTSEVYGDPEIHPQVESYWGRVNPIGTRGCYDEGKRFSEALSMAYRRTYGLDVRVARIFNTYGPRMDPADGRLISNLIVQGLTGKAFTVFGTGLQTRSFCYVSDLVRGLERLMDAAPNIPTPMNIGNPREFTILETVDLIARTLGVSPRLDFRDLPEDDPRKRSPDIRLARERLDWSPEVSFEVGLAKTIDFYRSTGLGGPEST